MKYGFTMVAILALALAGCGAGTDTGTEQAEATATETMNDAAEAMDAAATTGDETAEAVTDAAETATEASAGGIDTSKLAAAPDWKLYDLAGAAVSSDQFKGQVVVVDFWATWCGPCRKSIPDLIDLYDNYKDDGLVIVGVSLDQKGPSVVEPFVKQFNINYPVVMGNQQVVQDFGGIRGIPTAFVISKDGKIYQKYIGLHPRSTYEKDIKDLLGLTS